jgi:enoyl-CoA hydratase/carnithine racemase
MSVLETTDTAAPVLVRADGPAARITLNRPAQRNAMSLDVLGRITEALRALGEQEDVRAIVIEGTGPAFSAGHDFREMVGRDIAFYRRLFDACQVMMETVHAVPQPVIARVHAPAAAAGCQLVAACDLAVAVDTARFSTPGVRNGIFCSTPMVPLSRAIGRKRALEMLLTGLPIDARTALDWGLVNRVVLEDELDATVAELVDAIAVSSGFVVGIGKRAFYDQIDLDEHRAYDHMGDVMAMNMMAADAQEGVCAFLDKRDANWTGR